MRLSQVIASLVALACSASLTAQILPVDLNYNFNGIVHAGEMGLPDDPNGFRSISDRALDFTAGVPSDPLLAPYQIVATPGALDIVHLGNRNTVDNGNWAFDPVPDNDNIGIQPSWLPNPDQVTTPQVSVLPFPLPVGPTTKAAFLYQISNGGGSFDITFTFASTNTYTIAVSGPDWYGGTFLGTQDVDMANFGANLSITETRVDLSAYAGDAVTEIAFSNPSNPVAGHAIIAANFEYPPEPRRINQIALNYNFNGIVHAGESGVPDDPLGFRSISDRALDFTAGLPTDPLLAPYQIVDQPGALDIVHLGDRNTVAGGSLMFDLVPDNDDIGIQPTWLPNPDQTGPQTTTLASPILMDAASSASLLYQISNGGGTFDVEFAFLTGSPVVVTVSGGDWWGGSFLGTAYVDSGLPEHNLNITERTLDLSAEAGRTLTAISFQNRSNLNGGYAILAMNVVGCLSCLNSATGAVQNLGGGTGPTISTTTNGNLGADLDWNVAGATPSGFGFFALGLGTTAVPLSSIIAPCSGTIGVPNPVFLMVSVDPNGEATTVIPSPEMQAVCGVQFCGQYAELTTGACFVTISDALAITIGN